jgi:AcrR family transcriptional regulator
VNDRLYTRGRGHVNERARLVAIFLEEFEDQPDLADTSSAARRILATAAALFHERGAVETSVRDVTKACGLTPAALYNHFPSKDELLFTLVRHGHERMQRRIDEAPSGRRAVERFRAFVRAYVTGHVEHPEFAQMVRREYLHLSDAHYTEIVEMRRALRTQLADLLVAGERAHDFALIGGRRGAVGQAMMVLDMCSRTSDWYDRTRDGDTAAIVDRYELASLRLIGARG